MIKFIFLCCGFLGFAQVENASNFSQKKLNVNDNMAQADDIVGYQFYKGAFLNSNLTNNLKLQTGFLYTNTNDNLLIIDAPILLKYKIRTKFEAFFGSKLNLNIKDELSTMQPLGMATKGFGASGEFGLHYDVNAKMMLEFRYSLPIIEQTVSDPSTLNHYSGSLFRLGSRFKF